MSGVPFVAWPLCSDGLIIAQMLVAKQVASHIQEAGLADSRLVGASEIVDRIEEATNMVEKARECCTKRWIS
ncbi:hypothetical protein RvY_06480 [Ramazzottius varieornatus]|uniref:Uncharacterized protein n=1 Tax=Ramazzottius varieornatus TaxID=947166 RepID=A0A1D1UZ72_RAMVA|nr:hypothetical protein RvY_06480 [Ramazzottius varieornatus]